MHLFALLTLVFTVRCGAAAEIQTTEESTTGNNNYVDADLAIFLTEVNQQLAVLYNKEVLASWQNEIKGPNDLVAMLQSEIATKEIMSYLKSISGRVAKFKRLKIKDAQLRRQLEQIPEVGYEVLGRDDLATMYAVTANMSAIYRHAKLCTYGVAQRCNLSLVSDVQNILHATKNVDEIEFYWLEWRRKTGVAARRDFSKFIELYRKTANLNGFAIPSNFWCKDLEEDSDGVLKLLSSYMLDLQPLFLQFHGYTRASLRKLYGHALIPAHRPYPQNLAEIFIGSGYRATDVDGQIDLPYPEVGLPNITAGLYARKLDNPQRVFWNVDEYFRSMGLAQLEPDFLKENAQPKSKAHEDSVHCWHKAWKYYGNEEMGFSYCPTMNEEKFFNMFEAISDIYYIRAYHSQPTLFREDPFPNFSDGVAKFFSLAASSPKYLEKLKVIEPEKYTSYEARINRLYVEGLRTVFLLPIFYVLDRYRMEVLDGKLAVDDNCGYWDLTELYTGAEAPVQRTNADFDAPAKLLMAVDDQYSSQIMSILLQFQLYKHFCEATGQYKPNDPAKPLDLCDLSNHSEIGPSILKAMSLGSSQSYKEVLRTMTGENELSISGLLAYFQPLHDWLLEQNRKEKTDIGWEKSDRCTP